MKSDWKQLDDDINTIYLYFLEIINRYIRRCKHLKNIIEIKSEPSLPNEIWDELINLQHYIAQYFRALSLRFFPAPTRDRLYNYLFIKAVLDTFPENLNSLKNIKFLITHSNEIALVPIKSVLLGLVQSIDAAFRDFFEWSDDILATSNEESADSEDNIIPYAFECDPRENLQNKMVLGHEIFHIILGTSPLVIGKIQQSIRQGKFNDYFSDLQRINSSGTVDKESHIEELFCDFGAAMHLGPCYGFASLTELSFRQKSFSETHPPRSARIKIMLRAYGHTKHLYVLKLKEETKAFEPELKDIRNTSITPITNFFKTLLKNDLNINKYIPPNLHKSIGKHIEHKMPFMYGKDIRKLFNNLPLLAELSEINIEEFNFFLFESIRRNLMQTTFKEAAKKLNIKESKLELPQILQ